MTTQTVQLVIEATPDEVWRAVTDAAVTPAYYFGFTARYDQLEPGASYSYTVGDAPVITGRLREVVPGSKLSMTFAGTWADDVAELPESVVTYEFGESAMRVPGLTHLTLTHEGLPDTDAARNVERGWVLILSSLKTLLETGHALVPAPAPAQ